MIIFLGDIHGEFNKVISNIKRTNLSQCTIIQVGDFGVGFKSYERDIEDIEKFNNFLKEREIDLIAIRGNHDNPEFFSGYLSFTNINLIPDYTTLKIEGKNFIFMGGAVSIDRKLRKEKITYWKEETFRLDVDKLKSIRGIDVVVTHTAPDYCFPSNKNGYGKLVEGFFPTDKNLQNDLEYERNQMTKAFEILIEKNPIKKHFYGHFHDTKTEYFNGCKHVLLDVHELRLF